MTCIVCESKSHICAQCGADFLTYDVVDDDDRPNCAYCLDCWQAKTVQAGPCPCGRSMASLRRGEWRCFVERAWMADSEAETFAATIHA